MGALGKAPRLRIVVSESANIKGKFRWFVELMTYEDEDEWRRVDWKVFMSGQEGTEELAFSKAKVVMERVRTIHKELSETNTGVVI